MTSLGLFGTLVIVTFKLLSVLSLNENYSPESFSEVLFELKKLQDEVSTIKEIHEQKTQDLEEKVAHLEELSKLQVVRSCEELAQFGVEKSNNYWIDPDGPLTGQDPIQVFCDFTEGGAVTEISHDSEKTTEV